MATVVPPGGIPLSATAWHDLSPGNLTSPVTAPACLCYRDLMFLVSV